MHVIAEAGNNHNGDLDCALRLVDVAVDAGADSVKFQIIHPEMLYLPAFPRPDGYEANPVIEARRRQQLSHDDYREVSAYCRTKGIGFSASVFDEDGLDLLDEVDADYIKVASCDLNNVALVRAAAERGRQLVLSTGMATLQEIEHTLDQVERTGNRSLVLLHCVSIYPAQLEQMNLPFIQELKRFGFPVGLSDHTETAAAALLALALGAQWAEKHFTLDRRQEGFDHAYASEPGDLAEYIRTLRAAEDALDARREKVSDDERAVAERARRSIYARRDLVEGDALEPDDLLIVRPEGPLAAADFDSLLGRHLARPVRRFEPLRWEVLDDDG